MFGNLFGIFGRRSRTALVLVQPYTLLCEKMKRVRPAHKRSFERFVSDARARGAYVACISYSDAIWFELFRLSDSMFLFLRDGGFERLKKERAARALPPEDIGVIQKKAVIAGSGTPGSYEAVAEGLAKVFRKRGIRRILVCGGFDSECVSLFIRNISFELPDVKLLVAPRFIASWHLGEFSFNDSDFLLKDRMASEGINVALVEGDERRLLELF